MYKILLINIVVCFTTYYLNILFDEMINIPTIAETINSTIFFITLCLIPILVIITIILI